MKFDRIINKLMSPRIFLFLDQLVFSITNYILTLILARSYSDTEFAAFGIGLSISLAVQSAQRGLYIVNFSLMTRTSARRVVPGIVAEHLIFMSLVALCFCAAGSVVAICSGSRLAIETASTAVICLLIYFQADFDRAALIKRGSLFGPFIFSCGYMTAVIVLGILRLYDNLSFGLFMTGLGAFAVVKGLLVHGGSPIRWGWGLRFLKKDWHRYGIPSVAGAATYSGMVHVPVIVLGVLNTPAQAAGFVAMRSLTQPLMLVIRSLDAADKNQFRRLSGGTNAGIRRVFWRTMRLYVAFGVVATLALSIMPERLVQLAYHGRYVAFSHLIPAYGLFATFMAASLPIQSVTYLLGRQRKSILWSVIAGVTGTSLSLLFCGPFGANAAMVATVMSCGILVLGGIVILRDVVLRGADDSHSAVAEGVPVHNPNRSS